jgi:threonine dehydrogenase-like Zn-dependent dehydrogenase
MLDMFRKDLRLVFSRLYPADFTEAINLLGSGRLNWQAVVTQRVGLADLPAAVKQVMADPSSGIKILVHIGDEAG